jgi:hypothetical protein
LAGVLSRLFTQLSIHLNLDEVNRKTRKYLRKTPQFAGVVAEDARGFP